MFTDREPLQFFHPLPLQTALAEYSGMAITRRIFILVFSITLQALAGSKISSTATSPSASQTSVQLTTDNADVGSLKDTSRLSVLSLQLSDSAAQAAARDLSLSSKALGAKASELLSKISSNGYFANKAANDAEVPDLT